MNPRHMTVSLGPKPPPRGKDLPCDDGEPMETARHRMQASVLLDSLHHAWRDRHDFYAAANMGVYFSETQARKNDFRAPDLYVVVDTERHERRSWVAWEEDGRLPDVVVELISESTEAVDRGIKKDIYARVWHAATYVIYDPWTAQLDVYRLDARRRYERIEPDEKGDHPCEVLGLSLRMVTSKVDDVEAPWLRWVDERGHVLPLPAERADEAVARADAERTRADAERTRAEAAEARIARLEAELGERKR
jgi:Uma2 family endonuclease